MSFKNKGVLQGVLKYLGAISVAMTFGMVDPGPNLLQVPAEIVGEVIDDAEGPSWRSDDRKRLFHLLARDARRAVRARVAEAASALWPSAPEDALEIVRRLASDPSADVRDASSRGLAHLLAGATSLERMQLTCDWATSPRPDERYVIAAALCSRLPCSVADLVIEHLGHDDARYVRRAAIRAASIRFDENPTAYTKIARSLVGDPDRRTREAARRLVARSS